MAAAATVNVPRPAQGFTTERAQRWILSAAMVTAIIYFVRRATEPAFKNASTKGSNRARILGAGTPPTLAHWAVSYGVAFTLLSFLAMGAPELAASFAGLELFGTVMTNGTAVFADIQELQGTKPPSAAATRAPTAIGRQGNAAAATVGAQATNLAAGIGAGL